MPHILTVKHVPEAERRANDLCVSVCECISTHSSPDTFVKYLKISFS